jgi:hypothetical protein
MSNILYHWFWEQGDEAVQPRPLERNGRNALQGRLVVDGLKSWWQIIVIAGPPAKSKSMFRLMYKTDAKVGGF